MIVLFWVIITLIFYPLIIYPISLKVVCLCYKNEAEKVDDGYCPEVSFIIAAYNEEKVIEAKLQNAVSQRYDSRKLEIIVVSDGSTDRTNQIVRGFIAGREDEYPVVQLLDVNNRKGKTCAQNSAVKIARGEILVFSDSNSQWDQDALRLLVNRFRSSKIGYVCGKLKYINGESSLTSKSESTYWDFDLQIRKMESRISSIVGGNGAIYAIRRANYVELPPLISHDGYMPAKMIIQGMQAKFEDRAIAYEKASEDEGDEFNRKVRMNRGLPWKKYLDIQKFNVFKYGWFSYFYLGHKFLKYLLYILHPALWIISFFLRDVSIFFSVFFWGQCAFYILAVIGMLTKRTRIKIFYYPYHYTMTVAAQGVAVIKTLLGLSKPFWEKAETTR